MAKHITAVVVGGTTQTGLEVGTVVQVMDKLGLTGQAYSATVNGQGAKPDTVLSDYSHVTFAPAVKGGR
jgi:hypothetical protein